MGDKEKSQLERDRGGCTGHTTDVLGRTRVRERWSHRSLGGREGLSWHLCHSGRLGVTEPGRCPVLPPRGAACGRQPLLSLAVPPCALLC